MDSLTSFQTLFQNSIFKIPNYQRGYSWDKSNVEDLLEDLDSLDFGKQHYTGTLILLKKEPRPGLGKTLYEYELVDGQQRVTTLVILMKNIIEALKPGIHSSGDRDKEQMILNITNTYLWENIAGGRIYKLELQAQDNNFFKNRIMDRGNLRPQTESDFNIKEADVTISKHLEKNAKSKNYLSSLVNKIFEGLVFTVYNVSNQAEVGVIFETMNDRGKNLTELEKVKNFLLYLVTRVSGSQQALESMSNTITSSWEKLLRNLYSPKENKLSEDQLLRVAVILMFYTDLKKIVEDGRTISINSQLSEQFRLIKTHFKKILLDRREDCPKEIESFVNTIVSISEKYSDILLPENDHAFSILKDEDIRRKLIEVCKRYNRTGSQASLLPLFVSIYSRYYENPDELFRIMEMVETVGFRAFGLSMRRKYAGENDLYDLACRVYRNDMSEEDVINEVKSFDAYYSENITESLTDEHFNYYYWDSLEYFLYEYEMWRCRKLSGGSPSNEWNTLKGKDKNETIEHILPQKYPITKVYWTTRFTEETHKQYSEKLGNLVLTDQNLHLGQEGFDRKKDLYKNSTWQIERDLVHYSDWREKNILEREKQLTEFAEARWKI